MTCFFSEDMIARALKESGLSDSPHVSPADLYAFCQAITKSGTNCELMRRLVKPGGVSSNVNLNQEDLLAPGRAFFVYAFLIDNDVIGFRGGKGWDNILASSQKRMSDTILPPLGWIEEGEAPSSQPPLGQWPLQDKVEEIIAQCVADYSKKDILINLGSTSKKAKSGWGKL